MPFAPLHLMCPSLTISALYNLNPHLHHKLHMAVYLQFSLRYSFPLRPSTWLKKNKLIKLNLNKLIYVMLHYMAQVKLAHLQTTASHVQCECDEYIVCCDRNSVSTTLHSARWLPTVLFIFCIWRSSAVRFLSMLFIIVSKNSRCWQI